MFCVGETVDIQAPEPEQEIGVFAGVTDEAFGRYFADRERTERAMIFRSPSHRVAAVHSEMAERYEALARVFGAKPKR